MHPNLQTPKEGDFLERFGFHDKATSRVEKEHERIGKRAFGLAQKVHSEIQISDTRSCIILTDKNYSFICLFMYSYPHSHLQSEWSYTSCASCV